SSFAIAVAALRKRAHGAVHNSVKERKVPPPSQHSSYKSVNNRRQGPLATIYQDGSYQAVREGTPLARENVGGVRKPQRRLPSRSGGSKASCLGRECQKGSPTYAKRLERGGRRSLLDYGGLRDARAMGEYA